jgi:hypothetical protein
MSATKAREALERKLRSSLSEAEWDLLVEDGYDEEILGDLSGEVGREGGLDMAVGRIKQLRLIYQGLATESARVRTIGEKQDTSPLVHDRALSVAMGLLASEMKEVRDFREEVLNGRTLRWEQIQAWVEDQAIADGPATKYLEVPLPAGTEVTPTPSGVVLDPDLRLEDVPLGAFALSARILEYGLEEGGWVVRRATAIGGTLDRLRQLSETLENRFAWGRAEACVFVLTGIPPLVTDVRLRQRRQLAFPAASRLMLEVDLTVEPMRLAETYRRVRSRWLRRGHRRQSAKRLRLAVFSLEKRREGLMWAGIMREWNETWGREFARGIYKHVSNFRRDAGDAQRQLLGGLLDYPKQPLS